MARSISKAKVEAKLSELPTKGNAGNLRQKAKNFVSRASKSAENFLALRNSSDETFADIDKFAENPRVENIQDMFTVQMIVNFVDNKLAVP